MERSQWRVTLGADQRGYPLRSTVAKALRWLQCAVELPTPQGSRPIEYPQVAAAVARPVSQGQVERGILIGATGLEMAIVANKFPGVRAAACFDEVLVETSRRHLDLNVLCLSADLVSESTVEQLVLVFLTTPFDGARHARRIGELAAIEQELHATPDLCWLTAHGTISTQTPARLE
jgi:ribose 5-phosphate isomerase B